MLSSPSQQTTIVILGNTSPLFNQPPESSSAETLNFAPQLIQIAGGS
jgi:hypothetical protein